MSHSIQKNISCENCFKCGARPIVEQTKKGWMIACPNKGCQNTVAGALLDFDAWNRINKKDLNLKSGSDGSLKQSA